MPKQISLNLTLTNVSNLVTPNMLAERSEALAGARSAEASEYNTFNPEAWTFHALRLQQFNPIERMITYFLYEFADIKAFKTGVIAPCIFRTICT